LFHIGTSGDFALFFADVTRYRHQITDGLGRKEVLESRKS
jgi:hypothetical protein